jgi:hypothetical protein
MCDVQLPPVKATGGAAIATWPSAAIVVRFHICASTKLKDPAVLALAAGQRRVLVSQDVGTMPTHFCAFWDAGKHSTCAFLVRNPCTSELRSKNSCSSGSLRKHPTGTLADYPG